MAVVNFGDPHRAAQRAAVVVAALHRTDVVVRLVGPQSFIHKVVVRRSVKVIGAGLGGEVEQARAGLAEFGRVVRGLDSNLFNRVHRRLRFGLREADHTVGGVLAVDLDGHGVGRRAVHTHGVVGDEIDSALELRRRQRIPHAVRAGGLAADTQNGQGVQPLRGDVGRQLGRFGAEHGSFRGDRDGLAGRAYLKGNIDTQGLRHLNAEVLADIGLETGNFHR